MTKTPEAPIAKKTPFTITEHGHSRVDDYYWMRERTNAEVIAYLETENAYTERDIITTLEQLRVCSTLSTAGNQEAWKQRRKSYSISMNSPKNMTTSYLAFLRSAQTITCWLTPWIPPARRNSLCISRI
jgi:protease II